MFNVLSHLPYRKQMDYYYAAPRSQEDGRPLFSGWSPTYFNFGDTQEDIITGTRLTQGRLYQFRFAFGSDLTFVYIYIMRFAFGSDRVVGIKIGVLLAVTFVVDIYNAVCFWQ